MAQKSEIEWTDATWNPVTGCTKVGPGCDNCYAERFAERWRGIPGQISIGLCNHHTEGTKLKHRLFNLIPRHPALAERYSLMFQPFRAGCWHGL
ncbi:MAG: DUF5131 family protein [Paracoccaceae bacterium]